MTMDVDSLARRIARLEALEEIRALKARYWYACDRKDVEAVRDCFAEGPIAIDYDGTGCHDHRDKLYEVFKELSLHDHVVEHHHGGPPQITLTSDDEAKGVWSLSYHLMDTKRGTIHHIGGYYEDEYRRAEGEFRIVSTRFRVCSAVSYRWKEGALRVLSMAARLEG